MGRKRTVLRRQAGTGSRMRWEALVWGRCGIDCPSQIGEGATPGAFPQKDRPQVVRNELKKRPYAAPGIPVEMMWETKMFLSATC